MFYYKGYKPGRCRSFAVFIPQVKCKPVQSGTAASVAAYRAPTDNDKRHGNYES